MRGEISHILTVLGSTPLALCSASSVAILTLSLALPQLIDLVIVANKGHCHYQGG